MTRTEQQYATLLLLWSRSLDEHKLSFDEWCRRQK